jgi:PleD family two-component response regulator
VVESHDHSAEALLHYADANLYLAKAQGRNRIVATALNQEGQHVRAPTLA